MKTLRLVGMVLFAVLMCVNFASCSNDDDVDNQEAQKYTISLGCVGEILNVTQEPLSRAETPNLYEITVYQGKYADYKYATGTFSSKDNITIDLVEGEIYKFEIYYRYNTDEATNAFAYELEEVGMERVKTVYNEDHDYYYGLLEGYTPEINGNVDIYLKRMSFGLNISVNGLVEGTSLDVAINNLNINFTPESPTYDKILSFGTSVKTKIKEYYDGVLENDEYVDYYERAGLKLVLTRVDGMQVDLGSHGIKVQRNKTTKVIINIGDIATTTSNGLSITVENEEITDGSQYQIDADAGTIIETPITPTTEE